MKMKKFRKAIAIAVVAVSLVSLLGVGIFAKSFSDYYDSLALKAGSWVSFRDSQCANLTSQFNPPDTGNAGVYFYIPNTGVTEEGIYHSNNRKAYMELYEADITNPDDYCCKYIGEFAEINGVYRVFYYSRQNADQVEDIEDDNHVELYLKIYVTIDSRDSTRNINAGILKYRIWVE